MIKDGIGGTNTQTKVQLCIVHMVRHSVKFVPWKDYKAVTTDLKRIYGSVTEEDALLEMDKFSERWDDKYPQISRGWRANRHFLITQKIFVRLCTPLFVISHLIWNSYLMRNLCLNGGVLHFFGNKETKQRNCPL